MSLMKPWKGTFDRCRTDSGKLSGASGRESFINTVYSQGGGLLTLMGDVIGRWKEYLEDLLNPTNTSSTEEAESVGL